MSAVAINREPFADPRPLTPAEGLQQANHRAAAAHLRMRAALNDMEAAKIDLLRGEDAAHSALGMAVADYKAEYRRCLEARQDAARFRAEAAR